MTSTANNIVGELYGQEWPLKKALMAGSLAMVFGGSAYLGWYWCAAGVLVFLVAVAALANQATIDFEQRKVYEETKLFGSRVVRTRKFAFSDIEAIVYKYCGGEEATTRVGFKLLCGHHIWISDFSAGDLRRSRGAEEFAWRVHSFSGIKIDEHTG